MRYTLPRQAALIKSIATMGLPFGIATVLVAVQMLGNNLVAINLMGTAGYCCPVGLYVSAEVLDDYTDGYP